MYIFYPKYPKNSSYKIFILYFFVPTQFNKKQIWFYVFFLSVD